MGTFNGKVAFLTGAGSGIARAAAKMFAAEGARLGDGVTVKTDVALWDGVRLDDGVFVGPGARLRDTVVGSMSEIRSEIGLPTILDDYVALGDEVTVHAGVRLEGNIAIFPRLKVPGGIQVPRNTDITGPADILRYL